MIDEEETREHDQLPAVDEILAEKDRIVPVKKNYKKLAIACAILVLVTISFISGLAVGRSMNGGNTNTNRSAILETQISHENDPVPPGLLNSADLVILGIALGDGKEFEDKNSYQSKALNVMNEFGITEGHSKEKLAQRYALLCLYFSTNRVRTDVTDAQYGYGTYPGWKVIDPWRRAFADDECSWYGIACDRSGLVTRIELVDHLLTGIIPLELKLLDGHLTVVDFSDNRGLGQDGFPQVFLEINSLQSLGLAGCSFEGRITEDWCKIPRLTVSCEIQCDCCLCE